MDDQPTKRRNPDTGEWESVEPDNAYAYDERRDEWVTKTKLEDRNLWRLMPALIIAAVIGGLLSWLNNAP